jgi:hypothetical protein
MTKEKIHSLLFSKAGKRRQPIKMINLFNPYTDISMMKLRAPFMRKLRGGLLTWL